jgi:ribosomal protein S1
LREKIMSGEKESMEKLVERVDEVLVVLSRISEDLRSLSASIKTAVSSPVTQPAPQAVAPVSREIHEKKKSVDDVRVAFPENLEALLSFQEKDDYIMVKPKQFLGSENFAKIASAVRGLGGEYISAGKNSHFRVPK